MYTHTRTHTHVHTRTHAHTHDLRDCRQEERQAGRGSRSHVFTVMCFTILLASSSDTERNSDRTAPEKGGSRSGTEGGWTVTESKEWWMVTMLLWKKSGSSEKRIVEGRGVDFALSRSVCVCVSKSDTNEWCVRACVRAWERNRYYSPVFADLQQRSSDVNTKGIETVSIHRYWSWNKKIILPCFII